MTSWNHTRKAALTGAVLLATLAPSVLSASSGSGTAADPYILASSLDSSAATLNGAYYATGSNVECTYIFFKVGSSADTYLLVDNGYTLTADYYAYVESTAEAGVTVMGTGSKFNPTYNLFVGMNANGELSISGGGSVTTQNMAIGLNSGSNGTVTVEDSTSSLTTTTDFSVADKGSATLNIMSGALVSGVTSYVDGGSDNGYGGTGTVQVTGSGSRWLPGTLNFSNSSGGSADLYVSNGALVFVSNGMEDHGTIYLAGGTFAFYNAGYSLYASSWITYYPTKVYNGVEYVDATVNNITDVDYNSSNYVSGNSLYDVYNPLGISLVNCTAISGGVPANGDWSERTYSTGVTGGMWYCSPWYGWFYIGNDYNGWIWSVTNGWQYVYGMGNGVMAAWDNATGSWWYEVDGYYPKAYCYGTGKWYTYVSGVTPSREYTDDSSNSLSETDIYHNIYGE